MMRQNHPHTIAFREKIIRFIEVIWNFPLFRINWYFLDIQMFTIVSTSVTFYFLFDTSCVLHSIYQSSLIFLFNKSLVKSIWGDNNFFGLFYVITLTQSRIEDLLSLLGKKNQENRNYWGTFFKIKKNIKTIRLNKRKRTEQRRPK